MQVYPFLAYVDGSIPNAPSVYIAARGAFKEVLCVEEMEVHLPVLHALVIALPGGCNGDNGPDGRGASMGLNMHRDVHGAHILFCFWTDMAGRMGELHLFTALPLA